MEFSMQLTPRLKRTMHVTLITLFLLGVGIAIFRWWTRHGAGEAAPRIGLSVSDAWYDDLGFHRVAYDVALARAGARVVTLRPSDDAEHLDNVLADLDGILLAGGGDIEPSLYGGTSERASLVDADRDRFELEMLRLAEMRRLPVVGICRGIQLMAVAHGGNIRDLRREGDLAKTHGISLKSMAAHDVEIVPATRLEKILGARRYRVNSFHAKAVMNPGRMRVCARSLDGVVEGLELPGDRLVLGIQWHPEIMGVLDDTQHAIIEHLAATARAYRQARR